MKNCFIVLDLGSSSVRAMAFTPDGEQAAAVKHKIRADFPRPGIAEYDGAVFMEAVTGVYRSLLAELKDKELAPVSVGITGQRSTVALWDNKTGDLLAPLISWQDSRATAQLTRITATQDETHAVTGLYKNQYYSAPKITWALENIPAVDRAAKSGRLCAAPLNTYVIWRLTGGKTFACDPTHAQRTLMFDIHNLKWDERMHTEFGIRAAALPQIRPSVGDYGVCASTGLPIRLSIGDQQAAAIGMGVAMKGKSAVNYGTGAFFLAHTGSTAADVRGLLTSVACQTQTEVTYLLEASVNSAGSMLDWLNTVGIEFSSSACDELCLQSQHPVMFMPAMGGLGSPYWDFAVSPVITGITGSTTKADIVRGALNGIAHCIADNVLLMRANGVAVTGGRASGGLSECDYLLAYQSSIFGFPLERAAIREVTSFGAAYLLAEDAGLTPDSWAGLKPGKVFEPGLSKQGVQSALDAWREFSASAIDMGHKLNR